MNDNVKLEIAKEVIAGEIGNAVTSLNLSLENEELVNLVKLKEKIDRCDMVAINHVLKVSKARMTRCNSNE